ncbi:PhzF family phenazine biosynthesis protein [Teichococcus aestuarii]|uniref:PhzF family phenazine biosynthesis protein n=1 Tax=Teichococcus aestuarii TaxID=568898 RepID=UPI0036121760
MPILDFQQVDVFSATPLKGNPLAVVLGADGLSDAQMAAFANWTNLSETTFLLRPTLPEADYRVRIFTPERELPFAGHPTLGSCHAWLAAGGRPRGAEVVQECGVGPVRIRRGERGQLAFAAPPLRRSGPVEPEVLARLARGLRLAPEAIVAAEWIVNGPEWVGVLLRSRAELLAIEPDYAALEGLWPGVVAPWDPAVDGTEAQFELRAFIPGSAVPEDPVTGSLNAGIGQWLIGSGRAPERYVAAQGTVLGRAGRVFLHREGETVWVGGAVVTVLSGRAEL